MFRALFVFLAFSMVAPASHAWGKYGHVTICEIAYRTVSDQTREKLKDLMLSHPQNTSFNRACLFADDLPKTRPKEHFINLARDEVSLDGPNCGNADACLLTAIEDDLAILSDVEQSDADRARALVLLGHWVGDIHQPLHVSFADDRGGNLIKKRGRCSADNLHAVWDNCVVEHGVFNMSAMERQLGWQRFTKAYRAADRLISELDPATVEQWKEGEPWTWAAESFEIVRDPSVEYCTLKEGACWYESSRMELDDDNLRVIEVSQDYLDAHKETADEQISKAGVRLAMLLDSALGQD